MSAVAVGRQPVTPRGRRTRDAVVSAARTVFERRGFAATRMGDIAAEAGVSHGTVYTYFDTKQDVLAATLVQLVSDIRSSIRTPDTAEPEYRIGTANRQYLLVSRTHARLLRVVEEVSTGNQRFLEILADLRRTHAERVAAQIRRYQQLGLARTSIDADEAAAALTAMVEGYARNWPDRLQQDLDRAADTITSLWLHALGLTEPGVDGSPGPLTALHNTGGI